MSKRILIVGSLLAATAVGSGQAQAACQLPDGITIDHGNGAIATGFPDVLGSRFIASMKESNKQGVLDGTLSGREINFRIRWSHGPIGNYSGYIAKSGRISGTNYDERNPNSQTNWSIRQKAKC